MNHHPEPEEPHAVVARADEYCDMRRYAEAERLVRRTLVAWPGQLDLVKQLLRVLDFQFRNEECLEVADAALATWPEEPALYFHRGRALEYLGRNEAAIECLAQGVRLAPHDADMLRDYGEFLAYAGRNREAIEVLARALQSHPDDADLLCRLAHCHNRVGDNHRAHELLTAALAINPHDAITWYALADNHWALARARPSLAAYAECVRQDPGHVTAVPMVRYNMVWPISTIHNSLRWSLPVAAVLGLIAAGGVTWPRPVVYGLSVLSIGYAAHWSLRGGTAAWRAVARTFPAVKAVIATGIALGLAGFVAVLAGVATGDVTLLVCGLLAGAGLWTVQGVDGAVEPNPHSDRPVALRMWQTIATVARRDFTVHPKVLWRRIQRLGASRDSAAGPLA